MASRDQDLAHRHGLQSRSEHSGSAPLQRSDELKGLLSHIADQILDSDRRQTNVVHNVHDRLNSLGRETQTIRSQVPAQHVPVLERIEDGMAKLGERIADVSNERNAPAAVVTQGPSVSPSMRMQAPEAAPPALRPQTAIPSPQSPAQQSPAAEPKLGHSRILSAPPALSGATSRPAPAPVPDPIELVESRPRRSASEPWDAETAEALTRVYEALEPLAARRSQGNDVSRQARSPRFEARLDTNPVPASMPKVSIPLDVAPQARTPRPAPAFSSPPVSAPAGCADRGWLDGRLSGISGSIDQVLTQVGPDGMIRSFGTRFDDFEGRMGDALEGIATRSDVEGLRLMEAHLTELSQHFDAAQSKLGRLDGIETQLQSMMSQLSDERLSQFMPASAPQTAQPDLERLVKTAAEMAATQVQRLAPQSQDASVSELKDVLERFIQDSRQGNEQTAATLDMMQQALIRVLDRIDTLDPAQHHSAAGHDQAPSPRDFGYPDDYNSSAEQHHAAEAPRMDVRSQPAATEAYGVPTGANSLAPGGYQQPMDVSPQSFEFAGEERADAGFSASITPGADYGRPTEYVPEPVVEQSAAGRDGRPLSPVEKLRQDFIADAQRAKAKAVADAQAKAAAELDVSAKGGARKKAARVDSNLEPSPANSLLSRRAKVLIIGALIAVVMVQGISLMMSRKDKKRVPAPAANIEQPLLPGDGNAGPAPGAPAVGKAPNAATSAEPDFDSDAGPDSGEGAVGGQNMMIDPEAGSAPPAQNMNLQRPSQAPLSFNLVTIDSDSRGPAAVQAALPAQPAGLRLDDAIPSVAVVPQPGAKSVLTDLPPMTVGPLSMRLAAAKGDPSAEFEVGARLAEGKGTTQDFKEAIRWYQRSAAHGFAQAQYRLGTLYERGLGAPADLARARVWYQRAAEQGNVKAMHNLAVLSAGREPGSQDYATAARWFAAAAEHDLPDSQFNIGVLAESGLGVEKNLQAAYKWFSLASRSGDGEAVRRRDSLKAHLPPAELAQAEMLLKNFAPMRQEPLVNDARMAGEDWKKRQTSEDVR